jgi:hypothetical protein
MATTTGLPETPEEWAAGFLQYLGVPASGPTDPRLIFLTAWDTHEGDAQTNPTNGLAIEDGGKTMSGSKVSTFKDVQAGYVALHAYLVKNGITNVIQGLKNPASTVESLGADLAAANWEGSQTPQAKAASAAYANAVITGAGGQAMAPLSGATGGTGETVAQADTTNTSGLTPAEAKEIDTPYKGPGAYKGFDLSGITGGQRANVEQAITELLAQPGGVQGILNGIYKNYGSEAWAANIPEVRTLLVAGTALGWDQDPALFNSELQNTSFYKTTSVGTRNWDELSSDDPASAQNAVQQAAARITNDANTLGVPLTQEQVQTLAKTVASQSISSVTGLNTYDSTMVSEQQVLGYITAMASTTDLTSVLSGAATTNVPATSTSAQATSITGEGDAASLYNQYTAIARNYMLPMTPSQIAAQVQKDLSGDTGQGNFLTGAISSFTTYAQNQAKILYPAFAGAIGTDATTGNDQDLYQATANIRALVAQYTGNADPDTVNLNTPQYSWILSGSPPPSSATALSGAGSTIGTSSTSGSSSGGGNVAPPTTDQLTSYLMQQPQFQTTNGAKEMGWQVGSAITKAFGFN